MAMDAPDDHARRIVEQIRNRIEASKDTHIWGDYINGLKLIAQVVFTRNSGFLLELLQNAEDAGLGLAGEGELLISINEKRVKVTHNGKPFDQEDVIALCGIRSSKKPENGTLGYLGIGFKSVFKVTDAPEVYSGSFSFRFDRNHWSDPAKTPWHVLPLWVDNPSEQVDETKTTFVIPFRDSSTYRSVIDELSDLGTELFMFLKWVKRITAEDETTGRIWSVENVTQPGEEFSVLRKDGVEQRFRFFRHTLKVAEAPDEVRLDRLTQEYRPNVKQREISVAFAVDTNGDLAPHLAHALYGGVYSFLPLGESRSGVKFPIQADFLVQPGRDAINYEAKWNHWLVERLADLIKEAIGYFKQHPTWKYQYLSAFDFTKHTGLEAYDKLFGPKLVEPIEAFLRATPCVATADGGWGNIDEVIKINEDEQALQDLVQWGLLSKSELASGFGGEPELKVVDPRVAESPSIGIKAFDRRDLLGNQDLLEQKRSAPDAPIWFRNLYKWLQKHGRRRSTSKGSVYPEGYWNYRIVLTSKGELMEGGNVWLLDFQPSDALLSQFVQTLGATRDVLHPSILRDAPDDDERAHIRGFLTGRTGVQLLDAATVCQEAILPRLAVDGPHPPKQELLDYTRHCKDLLRDTIQRQAIWTLTQKGNVSPSNQVFFGSAYSPTENWEKNAKYVPQIDFLSDEYVQGMAPADIAEWKDFFTRLGVRERADNPYVEQFAYAFVEDRLRSELTAFIPKDRQQHGYDRQATQIADGAIVYLEVKGLKTDHSVELRGNEPAAAAQARNNSQPFWVCIVPGIPESPQLWVVEDPLGVGHSDIVTIDVSEWRGSGRRVT